VNEISVPNFLYPLITLFYYLAFLHPKHISNREQKWPASSVLTLRLQESAT